MRRATYFGLCAVILVGGPFVCGCGSRDGNTPSTASIPGLGDHQPQVPAGETAAESPESDKRHPLAIIHTSLGEITLRLDAEHAPISVDNFLTYIAQGHYDNTLFHQVMAKPAVILGGGYDTFQREKPTDPPIRNEAHNGLKNVRGAIGMARRPDSIDSSTSQFYINCADNPQLDNKSSEVEGYGYCVFGEVTRGMEVVDQIAKSAVHDTRQLTGTPVEEVVIKWIHVAP